MASAVLPVAQPGGPAIAIQRERQSGAFTTSRPMAIHS
jgi:hypothetical protein